jgi:hypothetical protein
LHLARLALAPQAPSTLPVVACAWAVVQPFELVAEVGFMAGVVNVVGLVVLGWDDFDDDAVDAGAFGEELQQPLLPPAEAEVGALKPHGLWG